LVIHGPIDDKQQKFNERNCPIVLKESLDLEMSDYNDGFDSKPLSKYMAKASRKARWR
jgi:hypothetical protein